MTETSDAQAPLGAARAAQGPRHFLDLKDVPASDLREMLTLGAAYKRGEESPDGARPAAGRSLAMVFEKPSTRTRASFEVGMQQMGGFVTIVNAQESQLGRGETIADTGRVLSRYVDAIMLRSLSEATLLELAAHATVPVINGLTDKSHPCQVMADVMTFEEIKGPIAGRSVAWVGDSNNVAASWVHAAAKFEFEIRIASPKGFEPSHGLLDWAVGAKAELLLTDDPAQAVAGADCVVTDTWLSMGNGAEDAATRAKVIEALRPYRVDEALMGLAAKEAIFMHCLPASREREVAPAVIDGPASAVWDEAENRLHAQKGILHWCFVGAGG